MPDIFDNFFAKISGGKSQNFHYGGQMPVNTGKYYSYHTNGTNNKYWMPTAKKIDELNPEAEVLPKVRMGSVSSERSGSVSSSSDRERFGSVSSESGM